MAHWQSTVLRAAAANRTSESDRRPTGKYHGFEAPLLTMLLVLASQALADWTVNTSIRSFFVPDRPIFGAGADGAAGAVFRDTGIPLLLSSIIWEGNGTLWKKRGLLLIILGASLLTAQDLDTEMSSAPVCGRAERERCWLGLTFFLPNQLDELTSDLGNVTDLVLNEQRTQHTVY